MAKTGLEIDGVSVLECDSPWKLDYAKRCLREELAFKAITNRQMSDCVLRMENIAQAIRIEENSACVSRAKLFELNVQYELEKDAIKLLEQSTYKKSIRLRLEGWIGKINNR